MSSLKVRKRLWFLFFLPFFIPLFQLFTNQLGPEPFEELNHTFGHILIVLVLINMYLGIYRAYAKKFHMPLKWFLPLLPYRRSLGVAAFVCAFFHVMFFFFHERDVSYAFGEIFEKVYLIFGFLAFIILFLLALTSNDYAVRKLKKYWFYLHNFIYLGTVFMAFHVFLIEKSDFILACIYFVPYFFLQILRVLWFVKSFFLRKKAFFKEGFFLKI